MIYLLNEIYLQGITKCFITHSGNLDCPLPKSSSIILSSWSPWETQLLVCPALEIGCGSARSSKTGVKRCYDSYSRLLPTLKIGYGAASVTSLVSVTISITFKSSSWEVALCVTFTVFSNPYGLQLQLWWMTQCYSPSDHRRHVLPSLGQRECIVCWTTQFVGRSSSLTHQTKRHKPIILTFIALLCWIYKTTEYRVMTWIVHMTYRLNGGANE
jgi:hypothetical protein